MAAIVDVRWHPFRCVLRFRSMPAGTSVMYPARWISEPRRAVPVRLRPVDRRNSPHEATRAMQLRQAAVLAQLHALQVELGQRAARAELQDDEA